MGFGYFCFLLDSFHMSSTVSLNASLNKEKLINTSTTANAKNLGSPIQNILQMYYYILMLSSFMASIPYYFRNYISSIKLCLCESAQYNNK